MARQDWSGWDDWCKAHIRNAAEENAGAVIDVLVEYVKEEFAKRDKEIASLRADLTIASAIARGEISDLRNHHAAKS